jgi:hypothetical protein
MKIWSERWAIKYLVSDHGICLGVDMSDRSYLFLMSKRGLVMERRPWGDKVVENLDFEIPAIAEALAAEHAARVRS